MSINDILYLKEENFIANIITKSEVGQIYSVKSEINRIAKKHLMSIGEYKKFARKELGLKNKIPIYFSNKLLLFNLKFKETTFWINYFNILKICYKENIMIIFKNGHILEIGIKKDHLRKEIMKTVKVLKYITNL